MNSVQSFIANYSVPRTLNELLDHWKEDRSADSNERIRKLVWQGEKRTGQYTVPRWAKSGDIVFLMESMSSIQHIGRMTKELYNNGAQTYNYQDYKMLLQALTHAKETYDEIGNSIYGIARVAEQVKSYEITEGDLRYNHWKSTVYAELADPFLLQQPIPLKEFKPFVSFSLQSSITPVFGDAFLKLKSLIKNHNNDVPSWFLESEAMPIPLTKLNRDNYLEVAGKYRRGFFLESQFRSYYVDYLLPCLGDVRKIYRECKCLKKGASTTWVDNVIRFKRRYLPVEVKLNIHLEKNLSKQLQQYMSVDQVYLTDKEPVEGKNILPCVLVVDTEGVYLYDGKKIQTVVSLDNLATNEDVEKLKDKLYKTIV